MIQLVSTHRVVEASVQSDEAEGDGNVVVVDPLDHVQARAWGGTHVRWWVEVQTLLPLVQAKAYLGVHWLAAEAREEGEEGLEEGDRAEDGRGPVLGVCKALVVADGREGGKARHVARGRVVAPGAWGPVSLWLVMLGRIQVPEETQKSEWTKTSLWVQLHRNLSHAVRNPQTTHKWLPKCI